MELRGGCCSGIAEAQGIPALGGSLGGLGRMLDFIKPAWVLPVYLVTHLSEAVDSGWGRENTKPYVMYLESPEAGAGSSVREAIK